MSWTAIFIIAIAAYYLWRRIRPSPTTTANFDDPLDRPGWNSADDAELAPSHPRPISATLKLTYRDANSKPTERVVDVKECDAINPAGYLLGFCHLRQAFRTFRMDRIVRAVDTETGELIQDLPAFAAKKYEESPVASIDKMLDRSADALRALFYIGKADGRFTTKEKQVFLEFCHKVANDNRLTLEQIDRVARDMAIPSKQSYRLICGRLSKEGEDLRQAVIDAAERMVATEKSVSADEVEALAYLKKRIGVTAG